jgi:heme A synthase
MTACRINPPAGIVPMNAREQPVATRSPLWGHVRPLDGRAATPAPAGKYDRSVHTRLARFAWGVLAYNIAVILWGAYVRASGSGAGCGSHWPFCNGEVLPRSPGVATMIEFSHRATSGLALLAIVALLVWTLRATRAGHPARGGAWTSLFFILTEAALGAGLVLFRLVADNATMARALFMAAHLMNTFILVACLTLTAYWLSGGAPLKVRGAGWRGGAVALGLAALILTGISGAVAALGDTLFPAGSLAEALSNDLSPTSHLLIRLRVLHPAIAIGTGLLIAFGAPRLQRGDVDTSGRLAGAAAALAALQLAVGIANVILLAPIWMQLVHLLVGDALWIACVLLSARVLGTNRVVRAAAAA